MSNKVSKKFKKIIKKVKKHRKKRETKEGLMAYFRTEYKSYPKETFSYWLNSKNNGCF